MKKALLNAIQTLALVIFANLIPAIASAQWTAPVNLSPHAMSATLNEDMSQCMAVSGNGDTVHVIWCDRRTLGSAIYYKRSVDGGSTWNTETNITDTMGTANFPSIAISGSSVHVVWIDSSLGHPASFYKRSLDGGATWGANVCLDTFTKFWPGVTASGSLVAVSINKEITPGNTEVFFNRSIDNGTTWGTEQQLSHAAGRSEDPAIMASGNNIHLAWNDKRTGQMHIYYIHSSDYGVTWGPETSILGDESYTAMVCLNGAHVDVACGNSITGNFDVYLVQSNDTGATWADTVHITSTPAAEAYPYLARNGMKLDLVYYQISNGRAVMYMNSTDGGVTWSTPVSLASGGEQPSISYGNGCILHVLYTDSVTKQVFYRRSMCPALGEEAIHPVPLGLTLSEKPNPFSNLTSIEYSIPDNGRFTLKVYDLMGREVATLGDGAGKAGELNSVLFDASKLSPGMYLCRLNSGSSSLTTKLVLMK